MRHGVSEEKVWDIFISFVLKLPSFSSTSYQRMTLKVSWSWICFYKSNHNPGILKSEEC